MNSVMGEACQLDEINDGSSINTKISIDNCVLLERDDVSTYFEKLEGSQPPQNSFSLKDCNDFSSSDISIDEHIAAIKKATEDNSKLDKQGTSTPDHITLEMSASILGIPLNYPENSSNNTSSNNITNNFLSELYPDYNLSSTSSVLPPLSDQTANSFNDFYSEFTTDSIINYLHIDNNDFSNTQDLSYLNDSDSLLLVVPSNNNNETIHTNNCIPENQAYELYANGELALQKSEEVPLELKNNDYILSKNVPKCMLCNNIFESIKDLRYHKRLHNIKPDMFTEHSCNMCQSVFNNHCSFTLHFNKIHKENKLRDSEIIYNGKIANKCQICFSVFTDLNTFFSHNAPYDYISNLVNYCEICDIKFSDQAQAFMEHCNQLHKNDMCFKCKICSTKMQLKSSLRRHIQFSHNVKKIYCKCCKSCLIESIYCKTHLENNENLCTYVCPFCDSSISTSKELQIQHINDHLNSLEATFQCGICLNYYYTYYNFLHHSTALHDSIVNIIPLNIIAKSVELKSVNNHSFSDSSNIQDELLEFINLDESDLLEITSTNNSDTVQEMRKNDCYNSDTTFNDNIVINNYQSSITEITAVNHETMSSIPSKKKSLQYFCEYCLDNFPTYKLLSIHLETCDSKDKKLPKQYEQFIEGNKVHGDTSRKIKITLEKDYITEKNKTFAVIKPKNSQLSKPKIKIDRESIPCTITSAEAAILDKVFERKVEVIKLSDKRKFKEITCSNLTVTEKTDLNEKQSNQKDVSKSNTVTKSVSNTTSIPNTVIVPDSQSNTPEISNSKSNSINTCTNMANAANTITAPNSVNIILDVPNCHNKAIDIQNSQNNTAVIACNSINSITSETKCVNNTIVVNSLTDNAAVIANNTVPNIGVNANLLNNIAVVTNSVKNTTTMPSSLNTQSSILSNYKNGTPMTNSINNIAVVANHTNNITSISNSLNNITIMANNTTSMSNSLNNIAVVTNPTNNVTSNSNSLNNIAIMANTVNNTTIVPNAINMVGSTSIQAVTSLIIASDIIPIMNQKFPTSNTISNSNLSQNISPNNLIQNQTQKTNISNDNTTQMSTYPTNGSNVGIIIMPVTSISNPVLINSTHFTNVPIINQTLPISTTLNPDEMGFSNSHQYSKANVNNSSTITVSQSDSAIEKVNKTQEVLNKAVKNYQISVKENDIEVTEIDLDSKQHNNEKYIAKSNINDNNSMINFDPNVPSTSSENSRYPLMPEYHNSNTNNVSHVAESESSNYTIVSGELVCSDTNNGVKIDIVDHTISSVSPETKPIINVKKDNNQQKVEEKNNIEKVEKNKQQKVEKKKLSKGEKNNQQKVEKNARKKRRGKNTKNKNETLPIKKPRYAIDQPVPSFEGNLNIPCLLCNKICINTFDLELHIKNTHNACKLCEIVFENKDKLKEHENDHKLGKIYFYMCLCTKPFKNLESLNQHIHDNINDTTKNKKNSFGIISEHGIMLKRRVMDLYLKSICILPTKAVCSYCNDIFDCECLDDHNEIIHNVCMCTSCDVRYVRKSIVKSKIDGDVLYLCSNCIQPDS